MADKAIQPSANPTVKLTAAAWAAAAMGVGGLALKNLAPGWYDPTVLGLLTPFAVVAFGWFVHDAPNVVVIQQDAGQ
jgi:hypothetical protein